MEIQLSMGAMGYEPNSNSGDCSSVDSSSATNSSSMAATSTGQCEDAWFLGKDEEEFGLPDPTGFLKDGEMRADMMDEEEAARPREVNPILVLEVKYQVTGNQEGKLMSVCSDSEPRVGCTLQRRRRIREQQPRRQQLHQMNDEVEARTASARVAWVVDADLILLE